MFEKGPQLCKLLSEPGRVHDGEVNVGLDVVVGLVPECGPEFRQGFKLQWNINVDAAVAHGNSKYPQLIMYN